MPTTVELQIDEHVARISFHSEKGIHVFSRETREQLAAVLEDVASRDDCRAVVFEAEGRTFLAGADLNELRDVTSDAAHEFAREGQQLMQRIADLPLVTLAAIHAACAGGGCELALACDLRMAAESARIGLPETTLGLLPGWGGTVRAARLLGPAAARRLILTGELLPAPAAEACGLIDTVTSDDNFRDAVNDRVSQILRLGPAACGSVKQLLRAWHSEDENRYLQEAQAFADCFATGGEGPEGVAAFLEKRAPVWGPSK